MCSFSWKLLLCMKDLDPYLPHAFLGPPESVTQTVSRLVQPFLHSSQQSVVGHDLPQIAPLHRGSCFLRLTRVHSHTSSAVCAQLMSEYHRACRCSSPSILPVPISGPHLRRGSLGQPDSSSQTTSRFSRHSWRRNPYTLQWASLFPQNCPYPWYDLDHPTPKPKQHLDRFGSFCTNSISAGTQHAEVL